ncbi:hypothetical protein D3C71_1671670 [compost metagenome]
MDAGRSWNFPHKPDRIQTDVIGTFSQIFQKHIDHGDKDLRAGKVEVNLVFAEGGPQVAHRALSH